MLGCIESFIWGSVGTSQMNQTFLFCGFNTRVSKLIILVIFNPLKSILNLCQPFWKVAKPNVELWLVSQLSLPPQPMRSFGQSVSCHYIQSELMLLSKPNQQQQLTCAPVKLRKAVTTAVEGCLGQVGLLRSKLVKVGPGWTELV